MISRSILSGNYKKIKSQFLYAEIQRCRFALTSSGIPDPVIQNLVQLLRDVGSGNKFYYIGKDVNL